MEDVIADDPVVAQADVGTPLSGDDGHPDRQMVERLLLALVDRGFGVGPDVTGLVIVARLQLLDELEVAGVLVGEIGQPAERRLDGGRASLRPASIRWRWTPRLERARRRSRIRIRR
jgi:hypothetical protein